MRSMFIIILLFSMSIPLMSSADTGGSYQLQVIETSNEYVTEYNITNTHPEFWDIVNIENAVFLTEYNQSRLWKFNQTDNSLTTIDFGLEITPLFINQADDGSLWFLDYDFLPQEELDHIVRYEPSTGNISIFDLPYHAHVVNFGISDKYVLISILNQDMIMMINTETYQSSILNITCDISFCGPGGADFDKDGNLWITETLGNRFIKYSFITQNFTFYNGIENFISPTYIRFDSDNTFWVGTHAGDQLANINITDMSYKVYKSPQPNIDQYPVSGLTDIEIAPNGDIWFAEHFINRMGRLHKASGTVHEYLYPRPMPLTAMISLDGDKLWYPESYGVFNYFDLNKIPTVAISRIENHTIDDDPNLSFDIKVTYLSGTADSILFSPFGELRHSTAFRVSAPSDEYILKKGEHVTIPIKISIVGRIPANQYIFIVGARCDTFTANQQFYLNIVNDWNLKNPFVRLYANLGFGNTIILSTTLVVLFAVYHYRKKLILFISKLKGK